MATGTITRNQNDWIFLDLHDVTTETQQMNIPSIAKEILVVVGSKNEQQVYGGKSFVLPSNYGWKNIIVTGELINGSGTIVSNQGCYFYYSDILLKYKAFDIESDMSILLRVYYR